MNFKRLEIPDIVLCEPSIFNDKRGYFTETYREDKLNAFLGDQVNFCQDNESKSIFGVLRGLHYQMPPYCQTKLVRVIIGKVLSVMVDVRLGSPTFGRYLSFELNEENKKQLLIPKGFANGFVSLSKETLFAYKVDNYYNKDSERGIAFDDPALNIDWKINPNELKYSLKDSQLPLFKDAEYLAYNL